MTCRVYVYHRTDVIDGQQWHAACAYCRWDGPPRTNPHMADRDAEHHQEEHP
jgi:hypothetical protein